MLRYVVLRQHINNKTLCLDNVLLHILSYEDYKKT